jgi:hypothetical protein
MLLPLAVSAIMLYRSLRSYPADVATAAAAPPPQTFWPAVPEPGRAGAA